MEIHVRRTDGGGALIIVSAIALHKTLPLRMSALPHSDRPTWLTLATAVAEHLFYPIGFVQS